MKAATINGILGTVLSIWIGVHSLGFELLEVLIAVIVANVAAVVGVLLTLQAEYRIKGFFNHPIKSWSMLSAIFLGLLVCCVPKLRNLETLATMFFPLLFSTGWGIMVFGPIQDSIVRKRQRRAAK